MTKGQVQSCHHWVRKTFGKPDHCDLCGKMEADKKYAKGYSFFEWSHRTHEYSKSGHGWWQLCKKCHRLYDRQWLKTHANVPARPKRDPKPCEDCKIPFMSKNRAQRYCSRPCWVRHYNSKLRAASLTKKILTR